MSFNKNIPNLITILRIVMSILFVYFIMEQFSYGQERTINLIMLFSGICISDLLDGKVARKTNSVSNLGAKLDVFADLFYIVLSYIALINVKIMPIWFLVFIFLKFFEFVVTSKFIKTNKSSDTPFVFDKVGRIVSATFLLIPGIAFYYRCLEYFNVIFIFNCALYVIFAAGLYSSYQRIKSCFMLYKLNNKYIN